MMIAAVGIVVVPWAFVLLLLLLLPSLPTALCFSFSSHFSIAAESGRRIRQRGEGRIRSYPAGIQLLNVNSGTTTTSPRSASKAMLLLLAESSSASSSSSSSSRPLLLYNSRTRSKDPFVPVRPPLVNMYTCGPTVYDSAHVGNFRAFLTYDLLKRILSYLGYDVLHICNLTDVDDKIIQRANQRNVASISEITDPCTARFFDDLRLLNVVPATHYPRATQHIGDMMDMILRLRDKGLAYETPDGSWYFDTQQQPGYGSQLVSLHWDDMMMKPTGAGGVEDDDGNEEPDKKHFADFCLWKAFKPGFDRDDASWSSTDIKKGRPGWHLECSAMIYHYLGDQTLDLHGGGVDLKFPHHENEIAQSQGCTGNLFCNCWFHNGFVNIGDEKMSKSLGNFVTLRQACPTPMSIRAYRYLVLTSQYRNPLSFTDQALKGAENALARIDKVRAQLQQVLTHCDTSEEGKTNGPTKVEETGSGDPLASSTTATVVSTNDAVNHAVEQFEAAIRDDLAMPRAAAALFSLIKHAEQILKPTICAVSASNGGSRCETIGDDTPAGADSQELESIRDALERMDTVLGIFYTPALSNDPSDSSLTAGGAASAAADDEIPTQVLTLATQRAEAKASKDWELADELRNRIVELGYEIKDVKDGEPIITRRSR